MDAHRQLRTHQSGDIYPMELEVVWDVVRDDCAWLLAVLQHAHHMNCWLLFLGGTWGGRRHKLYGGASTRGTDCEYTHC